MIRGRISLAMIVLAALSVGQAMASQLTMCPDNTVSPGPIAGLGDMESCGQTVTTGANSVEVNVGPSSIIANTIDLENWLGLSPGDLSPVLPFPFMPFGGSAALFPGFASSAGDLLQFSWISEFEPEATAFLFYALDNSVTVLDYQQGNFNTTFLATAAALQIPQSVAVPLSPGNHSLSFGVIVGSVPRNYCLDGESLFDPCLVRSSELIFDPILSITNLNVGPATVPEPGTVVLFGLGLLGLGALRRKRQ